MKFLAILRDSLRETFDVKLFHVLIGLSALVVLFVFSITYKPAGMEEQVKDVPTRFTSRDAWLIQLFTYLAKDEETANIIPDTQITDFKRLDGGAPDKPWLGDYQFTVAIHLIVNRDRGDRSGATAPTPEEVQKERKKIDAAKRRLSLEFMTTLCRSSFDFLEGVEVEPGAGPDEENTAYYTVKSHGTTVKTARGWFYQPYLFFGLYEVPQGVVKLAAGIFNFNPESLKTLGDMVSFFGDRIVGTVGAMFIMFLSIIMTASFLPNMLAKGSVDLLLVKPVHRTTLFLYKFTGGLLFMFLNTTFIIVGVWLATGIQTGLWTNTLLLCIPIFTLQFAIFYSAAALVAVMTRSTVFSILVAFMFWGWLFFLGWSHFLFIDYQREQKQPSTKSHWAYIGYDGLRAAMPRYKDIDWLTTRMIRTELIDKMYPEGAAREKNLKSLEEGYGRYDWGTSMLVTCLWIALFLGLSCAWFSWKDY
jgi:ABC-type transport system involved in multi-copper enzyme maturation permease subunit